MTSARGPTVGTHPQYPGRPLDVTPNPSLRDPTVRRGPKTPTMETLRGIAVSPGVAIGPVRVLDPHGRTLPPRPIESKEVPHQLVRLDEALAAAAREAQVACDEARRRLGDQYGDILAAHARMISDPSLRNEARARVLRDHVAAEHAVVDVLEGYALRLEQLHDSHLAARGA